MSLQVWLPLMEDFHNQGLANAQFNEYGTFTTDNQGKIGQCQVFNGSNAYLQLNNSSYNFGNSEQFSFAFWCNTAEDLIGLFAIRNSSTVQFTFTAAGIQYRDSKHSSLTTKTFEQPEANVWTHYALVYKTGSWYIYKNGQIKLESIYAAGAKLNANTEVRIGRYQTSSGSNYYNGKLNDFRIYDHALSQKEVEEIAKGLVLHYKLDQGNPNLFQLAPKSHSATAYNAYQLNLKENLIANQTYTVQLWDIDVSHSSKTEAELGISFYWGGGSVPLKGLLGTNYFTNGHADYLTFQFTPTEANASHANASNAWLNIYNSPPSKSGTLYMHIGNWKIEKGNIATLYNFSDPNIIYDSSGYQNNGIIIGDLTCDDDSPRYSLSTNFSALSNYITTPSLALTECSYSLWVKPSTGTDARIIFSDYKSGICFGRSTSYTYCNNTTLDNNNRYARYTIANDNSWQHFVIIRSGEKTITLYKNGELVNPTTTGATWSHNNVDYLMIGRRKYSTDSSYAYSIKGDIVDFREYATILTESQIQELYNTSMLIDANGNVYPRELVEK